MTMTDERLAELDAVMTRATEGPWQRKSGFEKLTIIGNIDGETVESQTKYTYEMVCEVYDDNGPIVAGRNVTAIVALHNAYPELKALIDAQAATIARLETEMRALIRGYVSLLETGRDRITGLGGECDSMELMEDGDPYLRAARAALTGAAS